MAFHWYIGRKQGETGGGWPYTFKAESTPLAGPYAACIGPFRTQRTAIWFARHRYATFNSMAEAERVRQSFIDSIESTCRKW